MEGGWNGAGDLPGRVWEGMSLGKGLVARQLVGPKLIMAREDWPITLYKLMKNLLCLEAGQWMNGGFGPTLK